MRFLKSRLRGRHGFFSRGDHGATAVEYGLMVALIAIVIIVAVSLLGSNLSSLFGTVASSV